MNKNLIDFLESVVINYDKIALNGSTSFCLKNKEDDTCALMYSRRISDIANIVIINNKIVKSREGIKNYNLNEILFNFDNVVIQGNNEISIYCKDEQLRLKYIEELMKQQYIKDNCEIIISNNCIKVVNK